MCGREARAAWVAALVHQVRGGRLEQLLGSPAWQHLLQDAAVVGIGQAGERAGYPAVQLRAARGRVLEIGVQVPCRFLILGAEGGVILPVALSE
jgi:hypothetical protein